MYDNKQENSKDIRDMAQIVCIENENSSDFTIIKNYQKESFVPSFNQMRYLKRAKNVPWAVRNLSKQALTSIYE